MTGNNAGPSRTRAMEPLYRPPGQRGILGEGLIRGGGAGRPFWRTLVGPVRGLTPMALTHTLLVGFDGEATRKKPA
jgi:hypothetical protein